MAAEVSATDGRKMWLSFVKEYENVHQVSHAQAMAHCSALWADPKVKEGYYKKKCKDLKVEVPKVIRKTRTKGPNPNPGKAGRPKGTTNRKAKLKADAEEKKVVSVIPERKSANIPPPNPVKVARKKRLTELEKKIAEMEESMKRMKPIDDDAYDDDEEDDSTSDYSDTDDE